MRAKISGKGEMNFARRASKVTFAMKSLQSFILVLLFGGIFVCSSVFAQTPEWKRADSENFHILSSAGDEETAQIVGKLEDFRRSFFSLFNKKKVKSPIPTRLLIFSSNAEFAEILNSQENLFQEGQDANYIVISPNAARTDLSRVYHQYFHYLLANHIGKSKIPAWLNEGLAQHYEDFRSESFSKTGFRNSENRRESLARGKLLPAEIFFGADYYTLNQQENHGMDVFYLQSAAFVEHLMDLDNGERFARYIELLLAGTSPDESFIKAFRLEARTVAENFKSLLESSKQKEFLIEKSQPFQAADLTFTRLSLAEKESYFGDFFYQSNKFDQAELHLLKSLSLNSLASFPKSTLGLVKLRQYKSAEALEILNKSLEYKDADFLTYFRCAYALSRQGMTEYGFVSNYDRDTAEIVRGLLKRAIELNPHFAESYSLYALVSFVRNEELEQGLSFINTALESAPGNDWFLLRKAELEMREENFTQARKTALDVFRNAPNIGLRFYAQNTIQRIDSTEYQLLLSRRGGNLPYSDAISEKPFSDEEIARLRAKAMRESLFAALRQPAAGEKRVLGNIVEIKCSQNQVDFTVETGNQKIKLYAESFEALKLMTFNPALSKSRIGCGAANAENAVIIYKTSKTLPPNIAGEIVSLEFVPKDFTLSANK